MADILRINGSVRSTAVTVGTAATALPTTNLNNRAYVQVYNVGTAAITLGGTAIASGVGGINVGVGTASPLYPLNNATLYASAVAGSSTVNVVEFSE